MPARLVQVTLFNNSSFSISWMDDGRPHGFWQDPWYPSNIKNLIPGGQATWRMESGGVATGVKGWVKFKIEVPFAEDVGVRTEYLRVDWERPYLLWLDSHFEKSCVVTLSDPDTNDPPHAPPALTFARDIGYTDIANIDSSPLEFIPAIPFAPFTSPIFLENEANPKHIAWFIELRDTDASVLLPLHVDTKPRRNAGVLWHHSATGESQIWFMDTGKVTGRVTVLGEDGKPVFIGPPWSIVGVGDFNRDDEPDILWHNSATNEMQIWFMNGYKTTSRGNVVGENGQPSYVGPPWSIVGVGDFQRSGGADVLWHNSATNEIQIWFMDGYKVTGRAPVFGEDGKPALVGPPWSIVGVGDFNRDGKSDILWHNSSTNETQIWFMDGNKVLGRATVLGEDGKPAFVGLPWSIGGTSDFNRDGGADVLWHNSATNETQIWFMDVYKVTGRATVLGEDGKPSFVGPPFSIVGADLFDRGLDPIR